MGINSKYKKGDKINGVVFMEMVQIDSPHKRGLFKCSCGNLFEARFNNIKTGAVKSCGCAKYIGLSRRRKERKKIICACGCGNLMIDVSKYGRNRKYIHGHNKSHSMPHSEELKELMIIRTTGKTYSLESRIKRGLNMKGENNKNWKGGVTSPNETARKSISYKVWRKAVFERDNYTCVFCGEKESISGKLEADHIKPFAYFEELRFDIGNGRTLCKECHKKTDTYLHKANRYKSAVEFDCLVGQ